MMRRLSTACVILLLLAAQPVSAHYLWLAVAQPAGKPAVVNLYFEGGPGPGDGKYLDPFIENGKTWVCTADGKKAVPLKMSVVKQPGKRWLAGEVADGRVVRAESYGKYGVHVYGKTPVLLDYYAKYVKVASAKDLETVGKADNLELELAPRSSGGQIELQLLWKGKGAAGRSVIIRGPGVKENLKTDESGVVRFKAEKQGQYIMRTYVETPKPGTDGGKEYEIKRHHSMLTLILPAASQ